LQELCAVWCAWAELEMKHEHFEEALAVMQQAVAEPLSSIKRRKARAVAVGKAGVSGKSNSEESVEPSSAVSERVHRSVKVWSLYLDLEESLGTVESCRAAYDRVMELKVITPQMVLNYCMFLEENNFFEDSFRVFERAVVLFDYPHVKTLWVTYLDKFLARYEGTKLERLRDLFEQAVATVPAENAAEFYLKYAKAEEQHGLARHAMAVYDRATRAVPEDSRADMYRLYIRKVEQHYGITKTRPVYERAIAELNDDMSRDLCVQYASVEAKLGEVDRARAVFQHGSQFADPRKHGDYWAKWKGFEEVHGNEDTFRDMLRVQRSVETANSQVNYLAEEMMFAEAQAAGVQPSGEVAAGTGVGGIALLAEQEAREAAAAQESHKRKFVAASSSGEEPVAKTVKTTAGLEANPDEIDIDIDNDEEQEQGQGVEVLAVKTKPIPSAVFGSVSLGQQQEEEEDKHEGGGAKKQKLGALERFSTAGK
jgi:pre-mRNA-splicing factor SYF1